MELDELSGLEILQKVINGEIKASMDETIPIKLEHAERGSVIGTVIPGIEHLSLRRGVHPAFHSSALAIITNYAFQTMIGKGVKFYPIDLNAKILSLIPINKELFIEGKVIFIEDHFGVAEGYIKDQEGFMFAHATATFYIQ